MRLNGKASKCGFIRLSRLHCRFHPVSPGCSRLYNRLMAGRISVVEQHKNREAIISSILAGKTLKSIASEFKITEQALSRFKNGPFLRAMRGLQVSKIPEISENTVSVIRGKRDEAVKLVVGQTVRSRVEKLAERYDRWHERVEATKDPDQFATLANSESKTLTLLADLTGERQTQQPGNNQVMVFLSPVQEVPRLDLADQGGETIPCNPETAR